MFKVFPFICILALGLFTSSGIPGAKSKITVYIFLSETCPICQSVSSELKKLDAQYDDQSVRFLGIFPDSVLSTPQTRWKFASKYGLGFEMQPDPGLALTTALSARITPEVVVRENETGTILYRGKIDNSFASLGKRRTVVTEHYLRSALESWMMEKKPLLSETEPVGCLIQK